MTGTYTEARARAIKKYLDARATVSLRVSKEEKELIKRAAASAGMSVNNYVRDAVLERLRQDEQNAAPPANE